MLVSFWKEQTNSFEFTVGGRAVCPVAFCAFWHLTRYSFDLLTTCIKEGRDLPVHGNFGQDRDSVKEDMCAVYLSKLADVSDQQPDSEEIHLVERMHKIDVYEAMAEGKVFLILLIKFLEYATFHTPDELPHLKTFYKVWRKDYKHLKIPKTCRLGKCDTCADLSEKIKRSKGIPAVLLYFNYFR